MAFQRKTIGIIGNESKMARSHFGPIFEASGHIVIGSDSKTPNRLTNEQVAASSDLVLVLTMPLMAMGNVIRPLIPHLRPGTILLHGASVQESIDTNLTKLLMDQQLIQKGITTGFVHLMAGPSVKPLRGQSVIFGFLNEPSSEARKLLETVFRRQRLIDWETIPWFHDYITGESQVSAMVLAAVKALFWKDYGLEPTQILRVAGPPARLQAMAMVRTLSQFEVVAEILVSHPLTLSIINQLSSDLREVERRCEGRDVAGLIEIAREGLATIPSGDLKELTVTTSRIIRFLGDMLGGAVGLRFSREENRCGLGAGVMEIFAHYKLNLNSTGMQTDPDGGCTFFFGVEDVDAPEVESACRDVIDKFGGQRVAAIR